MLNKNLARLIYDKSGGNPFYVEEITFSLIDREILILEEVQEGNEVWVVNPAEKDVELPDTIHGMVQTRIDKLDEEGAQAAVRGQRDRHGVQHRAAGQPPRTVPAATRRRSMRCSPSWWPRG